MRATLIWTALVLALAVPVFLAAQSPLLAWRQPVYIAAGFAGVIAFALMVLQPLLAAGLMPGIGVAAGRRVHRWIGVTLVAAIVLHVGALWITSPPDVIDALLFVSPTPFSDWGVIAMWALFGAAGVALLRHRLRLGPAAWRIGHTSLVVVAVLGSVLHALLVDGTMEPVSKAALSALLLGAAGLAVWRLKAWRMLGRRRA